MKKNGNITRLRRRGLVDNLHGGFGLVDNLRMTYEGNMLTSVCDSASRYSYAGATDFDGVPGQEYPLTYNGSGSLVSDAGRGIARTDYDLNNNPVRIQFTDGSVTRYIYSAAGEKLRVTHLTAVPNITVPIGSVRELLPSEILSADSTDYLLGGSLTLRNGRVDKLQFEEGYCQASAYSGNPSQDDITFQYYDRDHLGNIRQVIKATGSNKGPVLQTMDYYPFGAEFCHSSTASDVQSRKYNGKELDKMHGLNTYDYGARQYNPVTARWDRVDPLCEKYYNVSPYVYCHNNPVMCIDLDGRDWYQNNETTYYTWFDGNIGREGFTYIGGKGSLLGEFESKINNILINVFHNKNGLYSEGRTIDFTDSNKGAILPSDLMKMDDFLDEFVFGYGPEISILTSNHPYTKALQTDDVVVESQQKVRSGITDIPGQITKVKKDWGIWDYISTISMAKQFVGSYSFDSYTSNDGKHLLNIIYDTKNFRSLAYHLPGSGYLNHSRNSGFNPLANTYQFYIWKSTK